MIIEANNLSRQFDLYKEEYEQAALRVLRSGWYVLGKEVSSFEQEFASYLGVKHCIGLASGLDALILGFRLLGIGKGDEVIVASNAYIACMMGITINGASPIFVEPDENFNIYPGSIERAISPKTKAILALHLYGNACKMHEIMDIADKHGLLVVEDCAQAHGTESGGKKVGAFGAIGCFSFYPTKNLGGFGDSGAIVTDDAGIATRAMQLRNYGSAKKYIFEEVGVNSRLDELQAALLRVKLSHLDQLNQERQALAVRYIEGIRNERIQLPASIQGNTWHQFVVRAEERDNLKEHLKQKGIGSDIHYPIPPHLSKPYEYLGFKKGAFPICEKLSNEILSLPIYNGLSGTEQQYIIDTINDWR